MEWFRRFIISLITLLIMMITQLFAQETKPSVWGLQTCIEYALKNNIQIKQQLLNEESSRQEMIRNKCSMLPSINGSASQGYNWGRTVDRYTNQFSESKVQSNNFYLSSQVTLFSGFQLYNNVRQAQLSLEASKFDSQKYKNDIALGVATAYLNVLFSKSLVENALVQKLTTEVQLNRTKKMVEAGSLSEVNLLNIEAQFASEDLQLTNYENQLTIAYLTLTQMLDLKNVDGFDVETPQISVKGKPELILSPMDIYKTSLTKMPEIQSAEIREKIAQKSLQIARSGFSPSLTLQGSLGTGYSDGSKSITGTTPDGYQTIGIVEGTNQLVLAPSFQYNYATKSFDNQINDNFSKSLSFNLSVPIFNGYQVRSSVNKAKVNYKMVQYNTELQKNQLYKSIQQAFTDAQAALKKYYASEKAVLAYQAAFNLLNQKFTLGSASYFEYSDAKSKLTKAQNDFIQAKFDYTFKTKIIDFYLGNPIKLDNQ
ncbi:MAG: TolC family protein [Bacteroidota bacterium]